MAETADKAGKNPEYAGTRLLLASSDAVTDIFSSLERPVVQYTVGSAPGFDEKTNLDEKIIVFFGVSDDSLFKVIVPNAPRGLFSVETQPQRDDRILGRRWYGRSTSLSEIYANANSKKKCGQDCRRSGNCKVPGCVCRNGTCV